MMMDHLQSTITALLWLIAIISYFIIPCVIELVFDFREFIYEKIGNRMNTRLKLIDIEQENKWIIVISLITFVIYMAITMQNPLTLLNGDFPYSVHMLCTAHIITIIIACIECVIRMSIDLIHWYSGYEKDRQVYMITILTCSIILMIIAFQETSAIISTIIDEIKSNGRDIIQLGMPILATITIGALGTFKIYRARKADNEMRYSSSDKMLTINDIKFEAFKEAEKAVKAELREEWKRVNDVAETLKRQQEELEKKRREIFNNIICVIIVSVLFAALTAVTIMISEGSLDLFRNIESIITVICMSPFIALTIWIISLLFKKEKPEKKFKEKKEAVTLISSKPLNIVQRKLVQFYSWLIYYVEYRCIYRILCITKPDLDSKKVNWLKEDESDE